MSYIGYSIKAIAQKFRLGIYSSTELNTGSLDSQYLQAIKEIGNINNPILDLPLNNSLNLKQGAGTAVFTRSTVATYLDRYGVIQAAAIDEPRFEKKGLLFEGESTNNCKNSEDLSNATYINQLTTVTSNVIEAPDGTFTADSMSTDTNGNVRLNASYTAGGYITFSAFVKQGTALEFDMVINSSVDGFRKVRFSWSTKTFGTHPDLTSTITELDNEWFRVSVSTIAVSTADNTDCRLYPNTTNGTSTGTLYSWGWQNEEMSFCTSYIPTGALVATRANDVCILDATNAPASFNAHTVLCDASTIIAGNNYTFKVLGEVHRHSFINNSAALYCTNGAARDTTVGDFSKSTRAVYRYTDTNNKLEAGQNFVLTGSPGTGAVATGTPTEIILGSYNTAGAGILWGHLKNFRIYDIALTDNEIKIA